MLALDATSVPRATFSVLVAITVALSAGWTMATRDRVFVTSRPLTVGF
jgi:hypothetical protein